MSIASLQGKYFYSGSLFSQGMVVCKQGSVCIDTAVVGTWLLAAATSISSEVAFTKAATGAVDENQDNNLTHAIAPNSVGKLLGHVAGIRYDPRKDAYVVRKLNPEWLYNYEQRGKLDMTGAQRGGV